MVGGALLPIGCGGISGVRDVGSNQRLVVAVVHISSYQHTNIYNSLAYSCASVHSVSLGTDFPAPLANHSPANFMAPRALKKFISLPRQTSRDSSNMCIYLTMTLILISCSEACSTNNNVLIPSYVIRVI